MANSPVKARVLVVDDDSTCLAIVSAMLRKLHHEVITVKNPLDALCILRTKREVLDLVLSDVHMPHMSGIELQERVAEEFKIPFVLMSEDGNKNLILRGLENGAAFYILKPIQVDDLKNLWQLAIRGRKDTYQTKDLKRKAYDEVDEEMGDRVDYIIPKKRKVVWTVSLHNRFLEAVENIGFQKAVPKKILAYMNVPGLTRDHVASHLQKYRIFLKRVSAGTTSAQHEPSWKESPLGSNSTFHNPQLLDCGPHGGMQNSALEQTKSRSIIGTSSNSASQTGCCELPSFDNAAGFQNPSATITAPVSMKCEMDKNVLSIVDLPRCQSADKENSLMLSSLLDVSDYQQYSGIQTTGENHDVIGDNQMGLVISSSNAFDECYVLSNGLGNTNQDCFEQNLKSSTEQENICSLLLHLNDLRNEEDNHLGSENTDMLTFGDTSLTQLLGDDDNDMPYCDLSVESNLIKEYRPEDLGRLNQGSSVGHFSRIDSHWPNNIFPWSNDEEPNERDFEDIRYLLSNLEDL